MFQGRQIGSNCAQYYGGQWLFDLGCDPRLSCMWDTANRAGIPRIAWRGECDGLSEWWPWVIASGLVFVLVGR